MARPTDGARRRVRRGLRKGVEISVLDLKGASQRECPVDSGALAASATEEIVETAAGVEGKVSYPMIYALPQHERVDYVHPKHGKAHYLSDPLKARAPKYERTIGLSVRHELAGGGE